MAIKFNININGNRTFQVKVRIETVKGRIGNKEIMVEAKDGKTAGFEAEKIARKNPKIKTARWLFAIDRTDGSIHY
jgi:hypothetical protein